MRLLYYYPCKPNPLSLESKFLDILDKDPAWIAEIKKNGWRCLVYRESGVALWTRHKTIITEPLPALRDSLRAVPENTILDGELIYFRTAEHKGMLYLFDIIAYKGRLIDDLPLHERRKYLEEVSHNARSDSIEVAQQFRIGKKELFNRAIEADSVNEGIVLKKIHSNYLLSQKRCLQNPFWLKVKRIEKHVYVKEDR